MTLRLDGERLWNTIMHSARIGPGDAGGLRRLALTPADRAMRDTFRGWAHEAGLPMTVDAAGNMFARLEGREPLPPVLVGSHLDTQVAGGRFDGVLGVLAGLEVLRTLKEAGIVPRRPVEAVNWTNEEGARFSPPMMASAVFCGVKGLDWLYARTDEDGVRFGDALAAIGYRGEEPVGRSIDSYFELHIEQGPELAEDGVGVGIVTAGYAVHGLVAHFHGETAHTGPTPMARRRNALAAAAYAAAAVDAMGHRYAPVGKATVARLAAWPNKAGILPSFAALTMDARHADRALADAMRTEMLVSVVDGATKANTDFEIAEEWRFGDERFDPGCAALLREAADELGISRRDMLSQAGHDAYYLSRIAPTALLFSPCVGGITHNEAEDVPRGDTIAAANVLLNAVLRRAER